MNERDWIISAYPLINSHELPDSAYEKRMRTQEGRVKMAAGSEHGLKGIVWKSKFTELSSAYDDPLPGLCHPSCTTGLYSLGL